MPPRESLSGADAAWLRMDDPTNLMVICGVMVFDGPLGRERLKQVFAERMLPFRRFRQRVVDRDGTPAWEDDPLFDLDAHVHRIALPPPGGQAELEELVADLVSTPLDPTKPLWQSHLVDRFDRGSAVITRIHHAIADGIALVRLLVSMTDAEPDGAPRPPQAPRGEIEDRVPTLLRPALGVAAGAVAAAEALFHEGVEILRHPAHALELAQSGLGVAQTVAKLALLPADSDTMLKGRLGVTKRVAWTSGIALLEVKTLAHGLGGTVNDVLLAALAGALRRYLRSHDQPVEGVEIRIMMPVDLRPIEDAPELGNRFGLAYVDLPLGIADPIARVREIARRTQAIKESPDAPISFGLLRAIGTASAEIERQAIALFSAKATAVVTNVPGPRRKLWFAGRRLERMMFWVPQSGRIGFGASILSYAHEISVGITTDAGLVPDPQRILASIHDELADLARFRDRATAAGAAVAGD